MKYYDIEKKCVASSCMFYARVLCNMYVSKKIRSADFTIYRQLRHVAFKYYVSHLSPSQNKTKPMNCIKWSFGSRIHNP